MVMRQREIGTVLLVVGMAMLAVVLVRGSMWHGNSGKSVAIGVILVALGIAVRQGRLNNREPRS
jgi:lipopolysaccharide export LptBFGC system permease protein LptF